MLLILATFLIVVIETALATFVGLRAWDNRPARLFVLLTAVMVILTAIAFLLPEAADAPTAYGIRTALVLTLATFDFVLLLLLSALFMPAWWEGSRPIRWISLPYIITIAAVAIDLFGGFGIFISGVERTVDGYELVVTSGAGIVLRVLFISSWWVHLALLAVAFTRMPATRRLIGWLFVAIGLALVLVRLPFHSDRITGLIQAIPILSALAYAVIRTHLFDPTRVAIGMALRAMSEAVVVLDQKGLVEYANPRAASFGFQDGQSATQALMSGGASAPEAAALVETPDRLGTSAYQTLTLGTQRVEMQGTPLTDLHGHVHGLLLMARDITEIEERNAQLEQERARLAATVLELESEQRERAQLAATIRALSVPLIPVLEGVLVLPLVGEFDAARVEEFTTAMLHGIERESARLVLIDITGVPLLDSVGARGLLSGVRAAALLGARCVLVGVRPEIAQALVALGTPLDGLATAANLQQALLKELGSKNNRLRLIA